MIGSGGSSGGVFLVVVAAVVVVVVVDNGSSPAVAAGDSSNESSRSSSDSSKKARLSRCKSHCHRPKPSPNELRCLVVAGPVQTARQSVAAERWELGPPRNLNACWNLGCSVRS